jgi:hypothetical protein
VSLNEEESKTVFIREEEDKIIFDPNSTTPFGPTAALLGTVETAGAGKPLMWADEITENPGLGDTEEWVIHNFTVDAHPIHVHEVMFRVVGRGKDGNRPPEPWETGWKDTVIAYPGEKTRIRAKFDLPGFYVWHCHIVEHEDNEMMRPYHVGPIPTGVQGRESSDRRKDYVLVQNYPNPFNPSTNIAFQLPKSEHVELKIFDVNGREVRTLVDENLHAGWHAAIWDGRNDFGRAVASGIYFYRMRAGKFTQIRRMNLLR